MMETIFFLLGLTNSVLLILIFLLRKHRMDLVRRFNWLYLLLAIPAILGFLWALWGGESIQHTIFLGIFLAFLFLEGVLDFVLKINFRENFKVNWKYVIPYLCLYYASNYGFVVMPWRTHLSWGILMASLFVIQFVLNLWSHPKPKPNSAEHESSPSGG